MGFADPAGGVNSVVEREIAAGSESVVDDRLNGREQICRTVGAGLVERALRAGEHDRNVGRRDEVEVVGGFGHRVGAVGDDDAGHAVFCGAFGRIDDRRRLLGGYLESRALTDRLDADGRVVGQFGDAVDEFVAGTGGRLSARLALAGARDGAAGAEDSDVRSGL